MNGVERVSLGYTAYNAHTSVSQFIPYVHYIRLIGHSNLHIPKLKAALTAVLVGYRLPEPITSRMF